MSALTYHFNLTIQEMRTMLDAQPKNLAGIVERFRNALAFTGMVRSDNAGLFCGVLP